MKFSDYSYLAGQALAKNSKGVINAISAVIANEEGRNNANAYALKQLLDKYAWKENGIIVDSRLPMIRKLTPEYTVSDLILPSEITETVEAIRKEREQIELLARHNLEPRSRILCAGHSGTGKTAFSHALAHALSLPLYTVHWSNVIDQYLGGTSKLIDAMLEWLNDHECVFLFDEVDMILRERDDKNEIGEIKRVVCGILPQLERLNRRSVLVATTNHPQVLDSAVWRRFHSVLVFPDATVQGLKDLLELFLKKHNIEMRKIHFDIMKVPDSALKKLNYGTFTNIMENCLREVLVEKKDNKKFLDELLATCIYENGEKVSPDDVTVCDMFMFRLSMAVMLL